MGDFQSWNGKTQENLSDINFIANEFFDNKNMSDKVVVIQGDYLSGKTSFVKHALEQAIYFDAEKSKRADGIVKIYFDQYKKVETYTRKQKKLIKDEWVQLIPNLSVSAFGVGVGINLKDRILDYLNSKKVILYG